MRLCLIITSLFILMTAVWADTTPANTILSVRATLNYALTSGGSVLGVDSNSASITVKQIAGINGISPVSADSIPAGSISNFRVAVTNNGNGSDRYNLTLSTPSTGWTSRIYLDSNNDGIVQQGEATPITRTPFINRTETCNLIVQLSAPADNITTDGTRLAFSASSEYNAVQSWQTSFIAGRIGLIEPKWTYDTQEPVGGSIATAGTVAYTATDNGQIQAITVGTNGAQIKWSTRIAGMRFVGQPVLNGSYVFVPISDKRMARLDAANGLNPQILSITGGFNISANPVSTGTTSYAPVTGGKLAMIKSAGTVESTSNVIRSAEISSAPILDGTTLAVGWSDGVVSVINGSTLASIRTFNVEPGTAISNSPLVDKTNRLIFITTKTGWVYCISLRSQRLVWKYNTQSEIIGSALADGSTKSVYFVTKDRKVFGLIRATGRLTTGFPFTLPGVGDLTGSVVSVKRSAKSASPYLWIGTPDGRIYAVNGNNGYSYYIWDGGIASGASFTGAPVLNTRAASIMIASTDGTVYSFAPK